jgi:hypothetical protein
MRYMFKLLSMSAYFPDIYAIPTSMSVYFPAVVASPEP